MQCSYCREEIIDGAKLCRFCGKAQPLSFKEQKARKERRRKMLLWGVPGTFLFALMLIAMIGGEDLKRREIKMRQVATCALMTYEQFEDLAKKAAEQNDITMSRAEDMIARLACPRLAR